MGLRIGECRIKRLKGLANTISADRQSYLADIAKTPGPKKRPRLFAGFRNISKPKPDIFAGPVVVLELPDGSLRSAFKEVKP